MNRNTATVFESGGLVAGVDTHTDTHTVAILTVQGGVLSTETFPADGRGYADMITMFNEAGHFASIGVEGTNSYGSGLTRALIQAGFEVKEVLRPTRGFDEWTASLTRLMRSLPPVPSCPAMGCPKPKTPPAKQSRSGSFWLLALSLCAARRRSPTPSNRCWSQHQNRCERSTAG